MAHLPNGVGKAKREGTRSEDPRIVIGLWPQSGDVGLQDEKLRVNAPHPPITLAKRERREGLLGCLGVNGTCYKLRLHCTIQ